MEEDGNSFQHDTSMAERRSTNSIQNTSISNDFNNREMSTTTSTVCGPGNQSNFFNHKQFQQVNQIPTVVSPIRSSTKEEWQTQDDNRSQICQHIYSNYESSKQRSQHSGTNATTKRLSSNSRSSGWILPCANQAKIPNLSRISMEKQILPIQCPSIWIGTKPLDIYQIGQTSGTVPEKKRNQDSSLHGRFHPYGKNNNRSNFTQKNFSENTAEIGMVHFNQKNPI